MGKRFGAALALALFLVQGAAGIASAQPARTRILEGLSVREEEHGWSLRIGFNNRVRYLRNTPQARGRFVHIQLEHLALAGSDLASALERESLAMPRDSGAGAPVAEIVYDGTGSEGPVLEVRFSREVEFSIHQGDDFRSIRVDVADPSRRLFPGFPSLRLSTTYTR
jgi:hypothetical protein